MAPNIVFAPNITQNAEHRHRTQDTNTAHFRTYSVRVLCHVIVHYPGLSKIFSVAKLSQTNFEAKKRLLSCMILFVSLN